MIVSTAEIGDVSREMPRTSLEINLLPQQRIPKMPGTLRNRIGLNSDARESHSAATPGTRDAWIGIVGRVNRSLAISHSHIQIDGNDWRIWNSNFEPTYVL